MAFQVSKSGDVLVIDVEGQLIVGNRTGARDHVLHVLDELPRHVRVFVAASPRGHHAGRIE